MRKPWRQHESAVGLLTISRLILNSCASSPGLDLAASLRSAELEIVQVPRPGCHAVALTGGNQEGRISNGG